MLGRKRIIAVTLALSIFSFVLAMVALLAGSTKGSMEGYHILAVNTSGMRQELGQPKVSSWYSLHVTGACEGNFAPNSTSPGAFYNTTSCSKQFAGNQISLDELIHLDDDPESYLLGLKRHLEVIFVFYVLGSGFSALSLLACSLTLILIVLSGAESKFTRYFQLRKFKDPLYISPQIALHLILTGTAAFCLLIGSHMTKNVAKGGASAINKERYTKGISAEAGGKFMIISWMAFVLMFLAFVASVASWPVEIIEEKKKRELKNGRESQA